MRVARGITRTVVVVGGLVFKVPSWRHRYLVRGWLANRSEWKQRRRPGCNPPLLSLGHVVTVFRAASRIGNDDDEVNRGVPFGRKDAFTYDGDEQKPQNWGRFGGQWLLVDFDRAWDHPRGLVGGVYFWYQEQLARRWTRQAERQRRWRGNRSRGTVHDS